MADLAKAKGMTIEQLVGKLIAARRTVLQQAVDAKRITQEQMNAMLARMQAEMTEHLTFSNVMSRRFHFSNR